MATTEEKARISIRTDAKLKEEATKVLAGMHLDLSTAFNLFLDQVVKQNKLPFEITNETAEEHEAKIIDAKIQRGLEQAYAGGGILAEDYLNELYQLRDRKKHD